MKKNVKKIVILGSTAAGLAAVGASIAGGVIAVNSARATQQVNQFSAKPAALWSAAKGAEDVNESTTTNVETSNTQVGNASSTTIGNEINKNESIIDVDNQFSKFTMSINNSDSTQSRGSISFIIGNNEETTDSIQVSPGQTIEFSVKTTSNDDRLGDLRVYPSNNPGLSPEIKEISENKYSVTMPPATIDGKANPFYSSNEIKVTPIFCKKSINLWKYEFASRSYVLEVQKDHGVFDDKTYSQIKMEGSTDQNRNIQYRIYMNGHNLEIKNITIPAGAQLMFLNNINNQSNGTTPTVSLGSNTWLTKVDNADQIDVQGAIGRFSSVNYGSRMKGYFEPGLR